MKFNHINEPIENNLSPEEADASAILAFADAVNTANDAAGDVMEAIINLENFDEAFENLTNVLTTIEAHGVSAGFMQLVNGDGGLSAALGVELPAVVVGSNESQVAEIASESIMDKLGKAYQTVKKFLQDLWNKMVIFFKGLFDRNKAVLLKVTAFKDGIMKETLDDEAFGKVKMKVFSAPDLSKMAGGISALVAGMDTIANATDEVELAKLDAEFKIVGYTVKGNDVSKDDKIWKLKDDELKKHGYSAKGCDAVLNDCVAMVTEVRKLEAAEKKMDAGVKAAIKACDDLKSLGDDDKVKAEKKKIDVTKKNLATFAKGTSKIAAIQYALCSMSLGIVGKLKKKKDDK